MAYTLQIPELGAKAGYYLVNAFLPGLGNLFTAAWNSWDKKKMNRLLNQAREKALSYQNLTAKQQQQLNQIDQLLSDLNNSPSRATHITKVADDLRAQRSKLTKSINANAQIADLYSDATNYETGDTPMNVDLKLQRAKSLADKYEESLGKED